MFTFDPVTGALTFTPLGQPTPNPVSGGGLFYLWLYPWTAIGTQPPYICISGSSTPPAAGAVLIDQGNAQYMHDHQWQQYYGDCGGLGGAGGGAGGGSGGSGSGGQPTGSGGGGSGSNCNFDPVTGQVVCGQPGQPGTTTCCDVQPKERWARYKKPDGDCYCVPESASAYSPDDILQQTYDDGGQCAQDAANCNQTTSGETPPALGVPEPEPETPAPDLLPVEIGGVLMGVDWCERLALLRGACIRIGAALMDAYGMGINDPMLAPNLAEKLYVNWESYIAQWSDWIQELSPPLYAFYLWTNTDANQVKEYLAQFIASSPLNELINSYALATANYLGYDSGEMKALLVVRSILHYASNVKIQPGTAWNNDTKITTNVKVGFGAGAGLNFGVLDIGGKVGADANVQGNGIWKSQVEAGGELSPVLLPLVQLVNYFIKATCPDTIPDVPAAVELYLNSQITVGIFHCLVSMNGYPQEYADMLVMARRQKLHPKEFIEYARRNTDKPDEVGKQVDDYLRLIGYIDPTERKAISFLYDRLPSPEHFIHYLQRSVYDLNYVKDFQLAKGFDTDQEVQAMLDFIGRDLQGNQNDVNFWRTFGKDLRRQGVRKETAFLEFCSAWVLPEPGHLAEMLIRLRPARIEQLLTERFGVPRAQWNKEQQDYYDSVVFTSERYLRSLQEKHIAPYFRPKFAELAYHPIPIRNLRQLYGSAGIDAPELKAQLLDNRFSERSADFIVRGFELERRRTRAQLGHGLTLTEAVKQYSEGIMSEDDVRKVYEYFGFTKDEATAGLRQAKIIFAYGLAKRKLDALEKCYISGRLSRDDVERILQASKIDREVWTEYLDLWDTIKTCSTHLPTVNELVKSYEDQLIDESDLATALARLNYEPDAIATIVANATYDLEKRVLKEEIAFAKQQELALEKLAREIEKQIRSQQRRKKEGDRLQVNLDRALQRADLIELLPTLPDAEAKAEARAAEVRKTAEESFDIGSEDVF